MPLTRTRPPIARAYDAVARLEKALGVLGALHACIAPRLPLPAAEDHLDDTEDHLDTLRAKLTDALAAMTAHIETLEAA